MTQTHLRTTISRRFLRHATIGGLLIALWTFTATTPALAQDDASPKAAAEASVPVHIKESKAVLDRAKEAYNGEKYDQAAQLFALAAQIDPGARFHKGTPYRNMARCFFWLGNYDKAVFWYDVYLSGWQDAADHGAIKDERAGANDRRNDPDKAIALKDIYDRSLVELVDTLRLRLKDGAPAYTADGGGTTRLYRRAIELGYAMPELATWSDAIRARLLQELQRRWAAPEGAPLPNISPEAETLDVSRGRLAHLRSLAPTDKEMDTLVAYQRFINAWNEYFREDYAAAAGSFLDAAPGLPGLDYLPYASALASLRAGEPGATLATLKSSTPGAPKALQPYYELLRAEALLVQGEHQAAAEIYLKQAR